MRGALANVANVGQVRWTRERCETGSNRADGQAVWSWHPDAGVKFTGFLWAMVANKPGTPGRSRSSR
jgi:hypothetical protein